MTEHLFKTISAATAALHESPRARFYSSVLVPPSHRAFRHTNAEGEPEIIGHPSYWRSLASHPDVKASEAGFPDPFGIPVIDLDTDPARRLRVLGPIFASAMEPA